MVRGTTAALFARVSDREMPYHAEGVLAHLRCGGRIGEHAAGQRDVAAGDEIPLPCIAHWRQRHFIVVYAVDKNSVYVADPLGLIAYPPGNSSTAG